MNRGDWRATVYGVTKSQTRLGKETAAAVAGERKDRDNRPCLIKTVVSITGSKAYKVLSSMPGSYLALNKGYLLSLFCY